MHKTRNHGQHQNNQQKTGAEIVSWFVPARFGDVSLALNALINLPINSDQAWPVTYMTSKYSKQYVANPSTNRRHTYGNAIRLLMDRLNLNVVLM